jgi:TolC family type I secretion outer membrane protein
VHHLVPRTILLFGATLLAASALAQPLTLTEAYETTLSRNLELRGERTYVQAEKAGVDEAWAGVKPQVDFTAGYGRTRYKRDLGLGGLEDGSDSPRRLDVGVSQVLYSRKAFKGIEQAERSVDKTQAQFEATRSQIGINALLSFLDVRRLERLKAIVEQELESHQRQADQLREMLDRGFATRAQWLEARSRVDEVRADVVRLDNEQRIALQTLRQVTGLPVETVVPVNEQLWQRTRAFLKNDWQQQARAQAPSLKIARAESRLARVSRQVANAGHYPELSLRARYTDNDSFATSLLEERRIELQLVVPIYKGGATSARTRAARYREEGAEWLLANELERIQIEVERLKSELSGSYSNIQALKRAVASARESENAAEEGFNAGLRNLTGLLDVRKRRSTIEQDMVTAVYENLSTRLELLALAGELNSQQLAKW